ncbi:P-loop containing nucleoside triphosphate hydrolase [Arabidopsis thaliana x Arabidopsis arenosa]|uniref:P-loop containing nucleoside triphosphate hydrolase n=1 Tax=Arabidopsis thaliana x Arabidopsis arenosa TaxID=1240361 RepID=A0A8T2B049_9BRAS|nr:P-loop containing nucleoside triphosphate hydrolase [Arabidopsis thaliana x Arabidopsis arenosa]
MASLFNQVPSVSAVFAIYTSFSAIMMIVRKIFNEIVPQKIRDYITVKFVDLFSSYFQSNFTFVIEHKWDFCENNTFRAAKVYLTTRLAGLSSGELLVGSSDIKNPTAEPNLGIPPNTKIVDEFEGIHLEWTLHFVETKSYPYEKKYFHLTCKKQFREKIMTDYFAYLAKSAEKIMRHRKNLYIYTYNQKDSSWQSAIFEHHTTFETLAIEPQLKTTMIDDLDAFSKGKDFFKSVGRAWKRGYLLYGPPGTGKSSMVAAIANHMNYNIYDLQIQSVSDDGELRKILTATKNRSILLIEDIDCGADASRRRQTKNEEDVELQKQKKKPDLGISLSGLLNFVDGLWSSCGEERIIIFTTNHKEKLDPALLRPGRMDVHILMDYCTPFVLKKLKIDDHVLFDPIEKLVIEVSVTPAEIAQQLMASKNSDIALKGLLEFLENKKMKKEEDTKVEEEGEIEDAETKV